MTRPMNRAIFREYDIRGVADRDLDQATVAEISRALALILLREGVRAVAVGRDCRVTSPRIAGRVMSELSQAGLEVCDLGMVPTPVVYFAQHHLNVQAGVIVTGSHNPVEDNGLKIVSQGEAWCGDRIQQILQLCDQCVPLPCRTAGEIRQLAILPDYIQAVVERIEPLEHPPRVVIDCGNGATGGLAVRIYERLGCRVSEMFGEPDGRFPNRHPDPTVEENLELLRAQLLLEKADLGIAFDGDGDRIAALDEQGNPVWGDYLTLLFARDILPRSPGATVIGEVKCTAHLFREVERWGGKSLMVPSGHSLIKQEMRRTGALLAGEMSGHIFFADRYFGFDDAIYAGARLLELVSKENKSLSTLLSLVPSSVGGPEVRIAVDDDQKFQLVEQLKEWFSKRYDTILTDGVRIEFEDGWGLIRASNTGPWVIYRCEADTPRRLVEIQHLIESPLNAMIEGRGMARAEESKNKSL